MVSAAFDNPRTSSHGAVGATNEKVNHLAKSPLDALKDNNLTTAVVNINPSSSPLNTGLSESGPLTTTTNVTSVSSTQVADSIKSLASNELGTDLSHYEMSVIEAKTLGYNNVDTKVSFNPPPTKQQEQEKPSTNTNLEQILNSNEQTISKLDLNTFVATESKSPRADKSKDLDEKLEELQKRIALLQGNLKTEPSLITETPKENKTKLNIKIGDKSTESQDYRESLTNNEKVQEPLNQQIEVLTLPRKSSSIVIAEATTASPQQNPEGKLTSYSDLVNKLTNLVEQQPQSLSLTANSSNVIYSQTKNTTTIDPQTPIIVSQLNRLIQDNTKFDLPTEIALLNPYKIGEFIPPVEVSTSSAIENNNTNKIDLTKIDLRNNSTSQQLIA
jgi:hypothetical protein